MAAVLHVLDPTFFGFAMGLKTYFQKTCNPRDISPRSAAGFTINHIAAGVLPALAGLLWMVDYRIVFVAGAEFSRLSLLLAQGIRLPRGRLPNMV